MIKFNLKPLLEKNCYRCAGLTRKTGIPYNVMLDMYNNKTQKVNLEHLDRLCAVLHCSIKDILVRTKE